jgi:hypothetical protein
VKVRGFRIELGEIEATLERLRGVRQAVVVVREVSPGDEALVAYLTAVTGVTLDVAVLRTALGDALLDYMVPQHWVVLPELPLTSSGKVDRKVLPAPERGVGTPVAFAEPANELQKALAIIWADVRGFRGSAQTITSSTWVVTRSSPLVVSRIRRDLGVQLPLRTIFTAPTLSQLAEEVDGLLALAALPAVAGTNGHHEEVVL